MQNFLFRLNTQTSVRPSIVVIGDAVVIKGRHDRQDFVENGYDREIDIFMLKMNEKRKLKWASFSAVLHNDMNETNGK